MRAKEHVTNLSKIANLITRVCKLRIQLFLIRNLSLNL